MGFLGFSRNLNFMKFRIKANQTGADACHSVRHWGFRVLSTTTVTICHRENCFNLFQSTIVEKIITSQMNILLYYRQWHSVLAVVGGEAVCVCHQFAVLFE